MPLEIPKSPIRHPHHRASGFSIPGRLPCSLAVVHGLFAHSEALAQDPPRLTGLTISGSGGAGIQVTPDPNPGSGFNPQQFTYTVTAENAVRSLTAGATVASLPANEKVRLFFVGGPGGFCERHGKSYLTRRRRGEEGGGGGSVTGGTVPSV